MVRASFYLPERWTPLDYHEEQHKLLNSTARFRVVPAGRRSGKTERAKRFLIEEAMAECRPLFPKPKYFFAAPTRPQAKKIYWEDLLDFLPPTAIAKVEVTELTVTLVTGTRIVVAGMDRPQRIEGEPLDGGILDEFGDMKPSAWYKHLRPALSTRGREGWCWLIGKPVGRNHYYDIVRKAGEDTSGEWSVHPWHSSTILSADEIRKAKQDLDDLSFRQEYEAEFVAYSGLAYYNFDYDLHSFQNLPYDDTQPLIFTLDFNVDPGTGSILQENKAEGTTDVIGEIYIPTNSNSERVARKFLEDWGDHKGDVILDGDATGIQRRSSATKGSDWDLVKAVLKPHFGSRLKARYKSSNPSERSRVNCVNARLLNANGDVRFRIDRAKAPNVVKDFEGVTVLTGTAGELDKKSSPNLTHLTDGIGYYISRVHPISRHRMQVT